ncbi:CD40 ligand-like [Sinocyclocheilus rhinocerous]|uniref:CD40 ligand-like n=1 Tax=Sinocyclocheilus rhinocerous TaxID=307959 RepID=UPI0007B974E3|nr:PREDICTED: CD40 ligand-like [Sinocyclocheilus rhinocerous]
MINTFHSSYNPPPVPPRAGYSKRQPAGNSPLVKFLSVMLLLLMILTFGGFLCLFQKLNMLLQGSYYEDMTSLQRLQDCADSSMGEDSMTECGKLMEKYKTVMAKVSQANEKLSKLTGGPHFIGPAAHMTALSEHKDKNSDFLKSNSLLWDKEQSLLQDVRLSTKRDKLTIRYPGIYFIYSQVTFSKHSTSFGLKQSIRSIEPKKQEVKELLKSFCSLDPNASNLCTASLAGVFRLEKDQQLYVTVANTSLVNRDSCSFGLFKLR